MLDLVISGGEVIDGSGAPRWRADVGVLGGLIAAVGDLSSTASHRRIDASGHIVAPGFIDSHTHDDQLLLEHPERHPKLLQGVTTVITGNCGISLAPLVCEDAPSPLDILQRHFTHASFADYVQAVKAAGPAVNAAMLVGHTTLRVGTMSDLDRAANAKEMQRMQAALAEALQAGAIGLSTGVFYPPARAATTQELIDVAQPLAGGRGIVTMHIRDEAAAIDDALREALAVGRALDTPLVLSHHKLMGLAQHGGSARTLALIEAAAQVQSVCLDCYPYTASSTMLLPERVASSTDVQITWSQKEPQAAGRSLRQMAAERGIDPTALAAQLMPGGAIYFAMSDDDVDRILAHPLAMIGSDGLPAPGVQHPRLWGTFPRVLGHYSRQRGVLQLETAVHKMTGLTARRFGLAGRGLVQAGHAADLTVFDPATVMDRATYAEPDLAPSGIHSVVLNGQLAVQHGQVQAAHAGQLLRRVN
ncbi:MAG: D-aminoacylase [Rubrivivax sp.]|nr:D-aminoacylase [Rubrivivax sp.]MDP3614670.1 D-aminoacylase [Rubrivivax sp.]